MNKNKAIIFVFIIAAFLCFCFIFSEFLLNCVSRAMVYEDKIVKAEAILVLSGSGTGNRIKTAADLFHKGFGKKIFFSGFKVYPETTTSALMKKYALKLGVSENKIVTEISDGESSTRGESIANLKLLKKFNVSNFILVTSSHHTRRSKLIYQQNIDSLGGGFEFWVYPAPDPLVPIQGWWKFRTGQVSIFLESIKYISYFFDL
jgi:uncharacterized SAM-binding protein YcdF (DUF218 family)